MLVISSNVDFMDIVKDTKILDYDNVLYSTNKMLIGSPENYNLAIVVIPAAIASIAQIIVALTNSKREFRVKNGDKELELKGYSEKKIIETLRSIHEVSDIDNE